MAYTPQDTLPYASSWTVVNNSSSINPPDCFCGHELGQYDFEFSGPMQNGGFQYNETFNGMNNTPNALNNVEATVRILLRVFWLLADANAIDYKLPYLGKW